MKYIIGASSVLVILLLGALIFVYSGLYNMGATAHHNKLTLWMINTMRDNSIKYHANDPNIKLPNLSDTSLIKTGFAQYSRRCVGCHGAPGKEQGELAQKGYYPHPPPLVRTAKEFTPQQLFWITKNGLKMTAMPAFGTIFSDEMIWAIVAFTQKLPNITSEEYQTLANETKGETLKGK
jgi:mono/diheme cytochrome c family protein